MSYLSRLCQAFTTHAKLELVPLMLPVSGSTELFTLLIRHGLVETLPSIAGGSSSCPLPSYLAFALQISHSSRELFVQYEARAFLPLVVYCAFAFPRLPISYQFSINCAENTEKMKWQALSSFAATALLFGGEAEALFKQPKTGRKMPTKRSVKLEPRTYFPSNATGVKTITSPSGVQIRYKEPGKSGVCETTPGVNS
jgi:hypothetical protein